MKYRHEVKHVITYPEMLVLKQRLSAAALVFGLLYAAFYGKRR